MRWSIGTILIIILSVIAAVTAAAEISVILVSRLRLRRLASDGSKTAKIILKILETPEHFFGTILVVNNIVDTLLASIVTALVIAVIKSEGMTVLIATVVVTTLIVILEVTAKTLSASYPERISLALARPVQSLIKALSPIVKVFAGITNALVRFIGGKPKPKTVLISQEEIRSLIKMGEEDGVIRREESQMLSRVFEFSQVVVKNVMTPRNKIVAISLKATFDEILAKTLESGYSRLPVYRDTIDKIVGVISMKDLLNVSANKDLVVLQDIMYPPTIVSGSKKVSDLLKEFQKGHTHLAIVTDDKGRVEGLITLEDLLEEIVGEIKDESDVRAS